MGYPESMVRTVTATEARTHLPRLLVEVEQGGEIVITRRNKPVARLIRYETPQRRTVRLGAAAGTVILKEGWDAPLTEEELADWYGPLVADPE